MALNGEYDYRAQVEILQGGYDGEAKGVTPEDNTWHTTDSETGSATYTYYYTDSNTPDNWSGADKNAQSSQVQLNATDNWSVRIDEDNKVYVTVSTVVNWIRRAEIKGNPNYSGNWGRDIKLGRFIGAPALWSVTNDPIGTAHELGRNINLGSYTFTLAPGESMSRGSIWIYNHTSGFPDQPQYNDEFWGGISFRNNMPADYVPGAVFNGIQWGTCNSSTRGACKVYNGSGWTNCRTADGHQKTDNPPFCYSDNQFRNMYKIPNQY